LQKVFATSLIALFLVPLQSSANNLSNEDVQSLQRDFFEDTEGDVNAIYSEEAKPVICFNDKEELIRRLTALGEEPKIMGYTTDGHLMMMYIDVDTNNFTIVEFLDSSNIGCVISGGEGLRFHKSFYLGIDNGSDI